MKARKLPVEIEFFPCELENMDDIMNWSTKERPITITQHDFYAFSLAITTLEGVHGATTKDMIIKGVNGEVYPCKKDIFEKTYEIVEECTCGPNQACNNCSIN